MTPKLGKPQQQGVHVLYIHIEEIEQVIMVLGSMVTPDLVSTTIGEFSGNDVIGHVGPLPNILEHMQAQRN